MAACLRAYWPCGCIRACAPAILLNAICRSYTARSAEKPGICAAAGGGRGLELVPGGVGLLPHEHCKTKCKSNNEANSSPPKKKGQANNHIKTIFTTDIFSYYKLRIQGSPPKATRLGSLPYHNFNKSGKSTWGFILNFSRNYQTSLKCNKTILNMQQKAWMPNKHIYKLWPMGVQNPPREKSLALIKKNKKPI